MVDHKTFTSETKAMSKDIKPSLHEFRISGNDQKICFNGALTDKQSNQLTPRTFVINDKKSVVNDKTSMIDHQRSNFDRI